MDDKDGKNIFESFDTCKNTAPFSQSFCLFIFLFLVGRFLCKRRKGKVNNFNSKLEAVEICSQNHQEKESYLPASSMRCRNDLKRN